MLRLSSYQIPAYAPQFVAEALNLYSAEGISVEFISTRRGFGVAEAVAKDEADILCGNIMAVLLDTLTAQGADQLVAFALLNRQCYNFVLGRTSDPFNWHELLTRSMLVPSEYPSIWIALRQSLQSSEIRLDQAHVVLGFPALDAIKYFRAGLGDYIMAAPEMAPELHPVASIAERLGPVPWSVYAVKRRTWEERRPELESFRQAIGAAIDWMGLHSPDKIAEVLGNRFSHLSAPYLRELIARYQAIRLWPSTPVVNAAELDRWQEMLLAAGFMQQRIPTQSLVADSAAITRSD